MSMASRRLARCEAHGLAYDPDIQQGCTLCRNSLRPKPGVLTAEVSGKDVAMVILMALWVTFVLGGFYLLASNGQRIRDEIVSHMKVPGVPAPMPSAPAPTDTAPVLTPLPVPTALPMLGRLGLDRYGYPRDAVDELGLRSLLAAGEFAALTAYVERIQTEFEADFRKEEWVTQTSDAFATADPSVGESIDRWVKASPDSHAPLVARAAHRVAVAWYYRGGKFSNETAKDRLAKFDEILKGALPDVQAAEARRPKLVVARQLELWIDEGLGRHEDEKRVLDLALAACPACFRVRSKYLVGLTPRWGGSLDAMEKFSAESQKEVATNPRLAVLLGYADCERAATFREAGNLTAALEAITRALRAGEFHRYYEEKARIVGKLDHDDEALAAWASALEGDPQSPTYLANHGVRSIRAGVLEAGAEEVRTAYRLDPYASAVGWGVEAAVSALVSKGWERAQRGDDAGSIAAYDLALSLHPNDPRALSHKVQSGARILATDEVGRLEALSRENAADFDTFKKLDDELARTGEFARIVGHWNRYIAMKPDDARAYQERGGAYSQLHDWEHALADLDRACGHGLKYACDGVRFVKAKMQAEVK